MTSFRGMLMTFKMKQSTLNQICSCLENVSCIKHLILNPKDIFILIFKSGRSESKMTLSFSTSLAYPINDVIISQIHKPF